MKRKSYSRPEFKIFEVKPTSIIAASGTGGTIGPAPWGAPARSSYDDEDYDY